MNEKEIDIHKMCFSENPNNFDLYHRYTLTEKYENLSLIGERFTDSQSYHTTTPLFDNDQ
jgi:hypothetical protein